MIPTYEALTVEDPNPVKRWLHRQRYDRAVRMMGNVADGSEVLDFGAGNGELAHVLLESDPSLRVTLLEPSPNMHDELLQNTERHGNRVNVASSFEDIEGRTFSAVFCLSVLEHLPDTEILEALHRIHRVSTAETATLVEVPNELYLAAFLKGSLRHIRRRNEYDGRLTNIVKAGFGHPPTDRPLVDPTGLVTSPWYGYHMGFDHRDLQQKIEASGLFEVTGPTFAPLHALGSLASLDVYVRLSAISDAV